MLSTGIIDLAVWLLVLEVMAFCAFPYIAWMLPNSLDRGYGVSKIAGSFVFGLSVWLLAAGFGADAGVGITRAVFTLGIIAGYLGYARGLLPLDEAKRLVRNHGLRVEGLLLGLTALFALVRFYNPEIVWGEKPMDSTFLHFLTRSTEVPPEDPWAAGHVMRYYYVGIFFVAQILKLTGIPVAIGYNLAISSLAGLIGSGLYTLFGILTRGPIFSVIASLGVVLSSVPEVLRLCVIDGHTANFDTFWASTRLFTSPCFFEYTSWSLLFADLHAHVVAIPITVMVLTLAVSLFADAASRYTLGGAALRVLLGASLGVLFGANTWDFIAYGGVVSLLALFAAAPRFWQPPVRSDGTVSLAERAFADGFPKVTGLGWDGVLCLFGALPIVVFYSGASGASQAVDFGFVSAEEFNFLGQVLAALGYWSILLFLALGAIFITTRKESPGRGAMGGAAAVLAFLAVVALGSAMHVGLAVPWGIVLYGALTAVASWIVMWGRSFGAEGRTVAVLGVCAGCAIVCAELFFLIDRMNTVFKGYMAVWLLTSIVSLTVSYYAYYSLKARGRFRARVALAVVFVIVALLSLFGTALNIKGVLATNRVPQRTYTLDGARYLDDVDSEEAELIRWINSNIEGTPVMLEAQGPSYREFTRISMHTGLPTVLGWEYHVRQRGLSHFGMNRRMSDVRIAYSSQDPYTTNRLLLRNKVDLIIVSRVERDTYQEEGLAKFDRFPQYYTPLFRVGDSVVYVTYFSKLHPQYGRSNITDSLAR